MTYVPTWAGFIYLAVVIDVFSRKIVGWSFGERMTSDLVISALNMALITRKPESVIHRSTKLADKKRRSPSDLHLDRDLVQPSALALCIAVSLAHRL